MDREQMLATIDEIYRARIAGDTAPMAEFLGDKATFRLAGEMPMRATFGADGAADFATAVGGLSKFITMHEIERLSVVVEGNHVAARWRAHVQFPGREAFDTEIFNLWTFGEDGKVTKLREFVDTAKLASEVGAVEAG